MRLQICNSQQTRTARSAPSPGGRKGLPRSESGPQEFDGHPHALIFLVAPCVRAPSVPQVLWMLEKYWTKALLAIGEVVGVEAMFVADSERRRKQLDIRNANKPVKK